MYARTVRNIFVGLSFFSDKVSGEYVHVVKGGGGKLILGAIHKLRRQARGGWPNVYATT